MNKSLIQARDNIIESAGRTTKGFGLGRIIGQLYALLFFSPDPMSLDDMMEELKVSKGSISTNVRELEKWGAVRQVWIKGDRKDYYEAEVDFPRIIKEGILPFFRSKLHSSFIATSESKEVINNYMNLNLKSEDKDLALFYTERLDLIEKVQSRLSLLLKLYRL
jgi:DNA-binding transcriptional regulator GbsR (MarR family)